MSDSATPATIDAVLASAELDASAVYAALASERRRTTIAILTELSTPITVPTLARDVTARETGGDPDDLPDDRVERVHAMLYHVHVPKLAALGFVEYDHGTDRITDVADALDAISP